MVNDLYTKNSWFWLCCCRGNWCFTNTSCFKTWFCAQVLIFCYIWVSSVKLKQTILYVIVSRGTRVSIMDDFCFLCFDHNVKVIGALISFAQRCVHQLKWVLMLCECVYISSNNLDFCGPAWPLILYLTWYSFWYILQNLFYMCAHIW